MFTPNFTTTQKACSPKCALELVQSNKEKKARTENKQKKKALKPLSKWLKEAQAEFNRYIRLRDAASPCISCQRYHSGQYHAGHYRAIGAAPELRFEEDNCHKQCSPCNNFKSGNSIEYRIFLIGKIGQARVEWLEGPHEPKHYTIDEVKEIKMMYRGMANELFRAIGSKYIGSNSGTYPQ